METSTEDEGNIILGAQRSLTFTAAVGKKD